MSDDRPTALRFPVALVLSIACLTTPAWADFETGMDAYERGNYATALSEWRPLAEEGNAQAQLHLGRLYHQARGVPQDSTTARQWYEKAAAQGYASGQNNLGSLYADGKGVPKDETKGVQWIRKAVEQRDANGQASLGKMYRNGRGVPQDNVQAYMWFTLGAANGATRGAVLRDELAIPMTSAQLAEAQNLARAWKPKGK
jgi:TPR repeat protein